WFDRFACAVCCANAPDQDRSASSHGSRFFTLAEPRRRVTAALVEFRTESSIAMLELRSSSRIARVSAIPEAAPDSVMECCVRERTDRGISILRSPFHTTGANKLPVAAIPAPLSAMYGNEIAFL